MNLFTKKIFILSVKFFFFLNKLYKCLVEKGNGYHILHFKQTTVKKKIKLWFKNLITEMKLLIYGKKFIKI